ncbi:MAG: hypothetical protein DRH20_03495 [Deltaproteobacteria bacterium]|nr:MAG: hypothetical protein DRH20_03495 [Deltaproteobacteria bacterium]
MIDPIIHDPPISVVDLVGLKKQCAEVSVQNEFEVNRTEFTHEGYPYDAFVFYSRFSGTIDGDEYSFRKCYARGCDRNLCPHVSQAVLIANRYLQRDYAELKKAGIQVEEKLFTLEGMLVRYDRKRDEFVSPLILDDYIRMAKEGASVSTEISLEYLPAVEYFEHREEKRVFFTANFRVRYLEKTHICQRCVACFDMKEEAVEKGPAMELANSRLAAIYEELDAANIRYEPVYFS